MDYLNLKEPPFFHSIPNKQSIHIRHVSLWRSRRRRNSSGGSHSDQQHRKQEVWPDESGGIRHDHRGEGSPAEINLLRSTYKTPHRKEAEEEVNRFLAPFKALLHLCFPALAECDAECEEQLARTDAAIEFYFNLIFFSGVAGVLSLFGFHVIAHVLAKPCRTSAKWLWNRLFPSSQHGVARLTNNADQPEERQKLSENCFCFSKSKYSRSPKLKGLKGIAETYIQETDTDFTQEVEQHQEGTSGAVVPSSKSIGMRTSYF